MNILNLKLYFSDASASGANVQPNVPPNEQTLNEMHEHQQPSDLTTSDIDRLLEQVAHGNKAMENNAIIIDPGKRVILQITAIIIHIILIILSFNHV